MKQIRRSVFETNSSSSHSISIRKTGTYYTQEEIEDSVYYCKWNDWDGEINFWDSDLEFGRAPFEPLTNFFDKAKYAIASFADDEDKRHIVEAIMYEFIPGLKIIKYPKTTNWQTDEEETYYGYIDHQSVGVLQSLLSRKQISIREFLLNSKYVVFIDGDEYCIKEKLFDSNLIHKEDFEEV